MSGRNGNADPNMDLMRRMGSKKGYDPMPPDQHAWPMRPGHGHPHVLMLWSWMCDKTIRLDHRSPWAVNEHGRELHLADAAADLDLDDANARKAWREGAQLGLWHNGATSSDRRLYLCGEVIPQTEDGENLGEEKESEEKAKAVRTYRLPPLPPYIINQIAKLAPARRESLIRKLGEEHAVEMRLIADLTQAARVICTARQDTALQSHGIKKIREVHRPRDARRVEELESRDRRVESLLPAIERYVQTGFEFALDPGLYEDKNASVHTGPSLLCSEPKEESKIVVVEKVSIVVEPATTTTTTESPAPPPPSELQEVGEALYKYGPGDPDAARQLVRACRTEDAEAATAEIVAVIHQKGPLARGKKSPIGFLLTSVPKVFAGDLFRSRRRRDDRPPPPNDDTVEFYAWLDAKGIPHPGNGGEFGRLWDTWQQQREVPRA